MTSTTADMERGRQHLLGFYESDSYLATSVARFLAPASREDSVALVCATPEHRRAVASELDGLGATFEPDRYLALDARDTLTAIVRDGAPDPARFQEVFDPLVESHTQRGRTVYIFGELSTLLRDDGHIDGALGIEQLADDLARSTRSIIYCAYPTRTFADDLDTATFRAVCDAHSQVAVNESVGGLHAPGAPLRDVTELRQELVAGTNERRHLERRQRELESALDELLHSERLRDEFSAMVVHDIRNPTSVISALMELLRSSGPDLDAATVEAYLAAAARSAEQIERLLEDLALMGQLRSGQFSFRPQRLDLRELALEQARAVCEVTGRPIDVSAPDRLPEAYADDGRQRQILANLLSNATRYSEQDAAVTIHLEDRTDHIVVRVEDHGCGISAEDRSKLFQPFTRLSDRSGRDGGSGLGLYITKALVEGQGGVIDVANPPEGGTIFSYSVPTAADTSRVT